MAKFPVVAAGDAATKVFDLGFPFLDEADVRVVVNGVLKVKGTDYALQVPNRDSGNYTVRFIAAPANAAVIQFFRNTPLTLRKPTLEIGHLVALQALYRAQEQGEQPVTVSAFFPSATLIANTGIDIIAPCDGTITLVGFEVTEAVTTGGTVKAQIEGVDVTTSAVTVANSAAAGKYAEVTPTALNVVKRGQKITLKPTSFATAGAGRARAVITPDAG
jgi:hypothetical protein